MTTPSPQSAADIRRLTVRIVSDEVVRIISAMAEPFGGDILRFFIFTAIWTANSGHLTSPERFAQLRDIPPDSQRRPVSEEALRKTVGVPAAIFDAYLDGLIASGEVERTPAGLTVPSGVFVRPEMIASANEFHTRFVNTVMRLRAAGFSFGDADDHDGD
ncbi:hypothetical protein [Phenylobacterium sp.]|uniref:hypothetical protein n=1 Tax=Phenylobacterium sp. TaxID=1871053 RepID=UPI0035B4103A